MGVKPGGILHCWRVQVRWALALSITPLRRHTTVAGGGGRYRRQTSGEVQKLLPVELAASKGIELVY